MTQSIFIPKVPSVGVGDLTNMLFVDKYTPVPLADQNGSILAPYASIMQAINVIPVATNAAESRNDSRSRHTRAKCSNSTPQG